MITATGSSGGVRGDLGDDLGPARLDEVHVQVVRVDGDDEDERDDPAGDEDLGHLVGTACVAGHQHVDGAGGEVDEQVGDRVAEEVDEVLRDQQRRSRRSLS